MIGKKVDVLVVISKKNYISSHIIGMSIRLGLCEAPEVAQTVPINEHRGVGRPVTLAKKSAWLEQPANYKSQFTLSTQTNLTQLISSNQDTASASNYTTIANEDHDSILNTNTEAVVTKKRGRPPGSLNKK